MGVGAQDDSKRMGFGFGRFKEESDSESVEQESVPSKDAILGLEEYNYPVEMLSKEQEKDDINEVERRGSAAPKGIEFRISLLWRFRTAFTFIRRWH